MGRWDCISEAVQRRSLGTALTEQQYMDFEWAAGSALAELEKSFEATQIADLDVLELNQNWIDEVESEFVTLKVTSIDRQR
jgi:hypothetical protein